MEIEFRKIFSKDLKKIKDKKLLAAVAKNIREIKVVTSVHDIPNIKKLAGYNFDHRIRICNYGLGVTLQNNHRVALRRFLHRKDTYNKFP